MPTPEITVRIGYYMCGIRWNVLLIEPREGIKQEYLLAGGFISEGAAEGIKEAFLRLYESGRQGVPYGSLV